MAQQYKRVSRYYETVREDLETLHTLSDNNVQKLDDLDVIFDGAVKSLENAKTVLQTLKMDVKRAVKDST